MKMRFKLLALTLLLLCALSAVMAVHGKEEAKKSQGKDDLFKQVELLADSISIVRDDYVDEVDSKKLVYGAMKGMLSSLDDFSQFMEPDEYNEIRMETKGEFGGIGIEISHREGILTVVTPLVGTPAEAAGIQSGDKIVRINDKITRDMTLSEAVKEMRGKPGTTLKLTLWREKDQKILEVTVKRAMIKIHSIRKASLVEDKIGYIKIVEFQENTAKDLDEALKKLDGEGMDALILDLRNNPGGLLESAVAVSERFLPKDSLIVSIKARSPEQNVEFKSSGKFTRPDKPLIVMVNEGSASGSEIVAGAVQDNKRGLILGMKTFGKASVQTVIPLKDGSALRLTTASYYTPNGKLIRNEGIAPDVVAEREKPSPAEKEESEDIFEKLEEKGPEPSDKIDLDKDSQLKLAVNLVKAMNIYKERK